MQIFDGIPSIDVIIDTSELYDFEVAREDIIDITIDVSEYYDYNIRYKDIKSEFPSFLDIVIDRSELYDFEIFREKTIDATFDIIIDSSEYYDYDMGDDSIDYIIPEIPSLVSYYLLTEDNLVLTTEDDYKLIYI